MFDKIVYFPILKTKASEIEGLGKLDELILNRVTPIFDVVPINRYQKNIPSLDKHLTNIAEKISSIWQYKRPFILDLYELPLELRLAHHLHPLIYLVNLLKKKNISIVPATGLERDIDYNEQVRLIFKDYNNGILIRLLSDDLNAPTIMQQELDELIIDLNIPIEKIDLLIDLKQLISSDLNHYVKLVNNAATYINDLRKFRTIIISGSNMPKSIAEQIPQSSSKMIRRVEMDIWRSITEKKILAIPPKFSDYTIINPEYVDIDPRIYANTMGPNIKYTTDTHWLVNRGMSFQKHVEGHKQYYKLARDVVNHRDFMGANYSYGDKYIDDRAKEKEGPGIPWHWLRAGINHHITHIVNNFG